MGISHSWQRRYRNHLLAASLATAVLGASCGTGPSPSGDQGGGRPHNLDEGTEQLRAILDQTRRQALGGRQGQVRPQAGPSPCIDRAPPKTFSAGYSLEFPLDAVEARSDALLGAVERYWRAKGYELRTTRRHTDVPAVFAQRQGFDLLFEIVRDKATAHLSGGTPCLPPRERPSA